MGTGNLTSLFGIFALIALAWLFSTDRRRLNWHLIGWALALQMLVGLFIFVVPAGRTFFLWVNGLAVTILNYASAGTEFVFGPLAKPPGTEGSLGFILAFQGFPSIIFFSALIALLYHCGVMQRLIKSFAWLFTRLMRISGAESLCAASNIFVGIESAFTIRPQLARLTDSERCTVLTAGLATVASNVMAFYVFILVGQFPTIAGHLVSASLLSAPAALLMSKLLLPETGTPETLGQDVDPHYEPEPNAFSAIINGAQGGLQMIFGIVALLIAVLGLVALANGFLGWLGHCASSALAMQSPMQWSLEGALAWVFRPLVWLTGVSPHDVPLAARLVGERLILTEVKSYQDLAAALAAGQISPRSAVIVSYALCGFAHVASLAIFVGGITAIVPQHRANWARVAPRALVAATFACLLTACIAGLFAGNAPSLLGVHP